MRTLFSRRPPSSTGNKSFTGDAFSNQDKIGDTEKRERTISTGSLIDKNRSSPSTSSSLYAQPQDLLYPSQAKYYNNGIHSQDSSSAVRHTGKKARPPLDTFRKADVGDAPVLPSFVEPTLSKRNSKMLLNSFRSKKPGTPTENPKIPGFDLRNKFHQPIPSSTRDGQENHVPFVVVASRSLSTPALIGKGKPREIEMPPELPSRNFLHDDKSSSERSLQSHFSRTQSAKLPDVKTDVRSAKAVEEHDGVTSKQANIPLFSGLSPTNLQFLQAPSEKRTSRSAPSTPQLDQDNHSTFKSMSTKKQGETFTLKRAFTKKSNKKIDVQRAEEYGNVGSSPSQASSPSQFMNSRPISVSPRSQDLASELNELAVAHKEGLLGEDEYRMLRQNVFDKLSGRGDMEMPREGRLGGAVTLGRSDDVARDVDNSLVSSTPSMRSRSSSTSKLASLFRKGSNGQATHSNGQGNGGSSSILSGGSSLFGDISPSTRSNTNTLESQNLQARRARYLQSGVQGPSSPTYGFMGASNGSRVGTSLYSPSSISAGGVSISNGSALLGANYLDKSSDEIQAEIAIVEAEGRRILESFKSLQVNAMGRYNLDFAAMKRALQGTGLEEDKDGSCSDDYVIVDGKDSQRTYTHGNGSGDLLNGLIRKTKSFSTRNSPSSSINHRRAEKRGDLKMPPSSYKIVFNSSAPVSPSSPLSPLSANSTVLDVEEGEEEEMAGVVELHSELKEIVKRRNEVSKKYTDRIAFLRSTLRSAKIREGLK